MGTRYTRSHIQTPNYRSGNGAFSNFYHYDLVSDQERVRACKGGIDYHTNKDSIFCELGCGSGIFSIYAATRFKKVYAVEIDSGILNLARSNAEKAKVSDQIEFIHADATSVVLPEKADIIFCEMMSTWLVNEPQALVANYAQQAILQKSGTFVPGAVINLVELGNADFQFDGIEIRVPFTQFTGIKAPRILTESRVFNKFDFRTPVTADVRGRLEIEALATGIVNCARLSSIVQFAPGITFYSTDTLMPLTIVPLRNDIKVNAGQKIMFEAQYRHRSELDECQFNATPM